VTSASPDTLLAKRLSLPLCGIRDFRKRLPPFLRVSKGVSFGRVVAAEFLRGRFYAREKLLNPM